MINTNTASNVVFTVVLQYYLGSVVEPVDDALHALLVVGDHLVGHAVGVHDLKRENTKGKPKREIPGLNGLWVITTRKAKASPLTRTRP